MVFAVDELRQTIVFTYSRFKIDLSLLLAHSHITNSQLNWDQSFKDRILDFDNLNPQKQPLSLRSFWDIFWFYNISKSSIKLIFFFFSYELSESIFKLISVILQIDIRRRFERKFIPMSCNDNTMMELFYFIFYFIFFMDHLNVKLIFKIN